MKILMISPYFAPFTGVGALRMTSLADYLVKRGESITVVKIADHCLAGEFLGGALVDGVSCREYELVSGNREATVASLADCLHKTCEEEQFDCCIATFGPYETIPAISKVIGKHKIPLVVDYRDLLLYDPRPCTSLSSIIAKIKTWVKYYVPEQRLLRLCGAFVTITPRSLKTMLQHYPYLKGKGHCIFNGYTPIDAIEKGVTRNPDGQTRIFVLGKLSGYTSEGAKNLFRAVKSLIEKGYTVSITHAGMDKNIPAIMEEVGFPTEHYHGLGQLPYEQAMAAASNADICTAIINYKEGLGTKVFDYIYLNRPIVAFAPEDSELEEILKPAENAFVCQTVEQFETAVENVIEKNRLTLASDPQYAKSFARAAQNEQYYSLLKELAGKRNTI